MHNKTRSILKSTAVVLGVGVMFAAGGASAAGTGWDYSTVTAGVDFSTVTPGALSSFGLMTVVAAGIWGGKRIMRIFG